MMFQNEGILITIILLQGTVVEGTIQKLFEGHHMNYIECINVNFKSTRKESYYGTTTGMNLIFLTYLCNLFF